MTKNIGDYSKKIKAMKSIETPFSKSFEAQIFKGQEWYLSLIDQGQFQISPAKRSTTASLEEIKKVEVDLQGKKVVFLGDTFDASSNQEDLLAKMMSAMKLNSENLIRMKINSELESISTKGHETHPQFINLMNELKELKPDVVVTLGAAATHLLLNKKEKLSSIHGQIFPYQWNDFKTFFCPVFHPDFLLINPNMKRTAWMDLLKVLEFLGKN